MKEFESAVLLNMVPEIGSVRFMALRDHFGSTSQVFEASLEQLKCVEGLSADIARRILSLGRNRELLQKELETAASEGITILTWDHPNYPAILRLIKSAPPVLYCKGKLDLLSACSIGLVGTRRPTPYGERVSVVLSKELAQLGVVTVSGLARGIDTCVHRSTLEARGHTLAVLGSGLMQVYPSENKGLFQRIAKEGLVCSEFPLQAAPNAGHFPQRNRIISGISMGTVVIEADEKSGALITARLAAEQGKDVFAVPGPIGSKMSRGPHRLIQDGAKLVTRAQDIIEEIEPLKSSLMKVLLETKTGDSSKENATMPNLGSEEKRLLERIHFEPVHIDVLSSNGEIPTGEFSKILLGLEMKGLVRPLPGKMYVRN